MFSCQKWILLKSDLWFGPSPYFLVGIQNFPVLMQGNEGHNSFIFADKNLSTLMLIL